MSQYPERDMFGGARFARLVRDEHEYWVEWVFSAPEDYYEESITEVKHAATPQQAMQNARDALADFMAQIDRGEYWTDDTEFEEEYGEKSARVLTPGYMDDVIYLRYTMAVAGQAQFMLIGVVMGDHTDVAAAVRNACLTGVADLAKQLDGIPDLDSKRWMLIQ